jgi:hypothetical protein
LLAIAIYVSTIGLPVNVWRQISALPMEYGAIFFLPGIHFLIKYFRTQRLKHLILAAEVMMLTVLIHPFTAIMVGVSYIIIMLLHANKWLCPAKFSRLAGYMLAAGIIGLLPVIFGLLSGKKFHSISINYIKDSIQVPGAGAASNKGFTVILDYFMANPVILVFLVCSCMTLISLLISRQAEKQSILSLLAAAIVLFIMMKSTELGLPSLMPEDRIGVFFAILAAIVIALPLRLLNTNYMSGKWQNIAKSIVCGMALLLVVYFGDFRTPEGTRFQYDQAVQNAEMIKKQYSFLDWTLISPVEESPIIRGYGWHTELWEFIYVLTDPTAAAKLEIKTKHAFFFVEKIPLRSDQVNDPALVPINSAMAARPFPKPEGNDLTDFYYRTPDTRALLEAKLNEWAEGYMQKYKDMDVIYEDEAFKVYRWTNPGKEVLKLKY